MSQKSKKGTWTIAYEKNVQELKNRILGSKITTFIMLSTAYGISCKISDPISINRFIEIIINFATLTLVIFPSVLSLWLKFQNRVLDFAVAEYKIQAHTKISKVIVDQLSQIFIIIPLCFITILITNLLWKKILLGITFLILFDLIKQLLTFIEIALLDYIRIESGYESYLKDQ
ncbi:MAG: hypothetical protein ACRCV0_01390 [Brevinema sp.]